MVMSAALLISGVLAIAPASWAQGNSPVDLFDDRFAGGADPGPVYRIQPNDLLRIFVYGEEELSGPVLVRPDGRISVPLAQDVQAAGLTPEQLKLAIEERLRGPIVDPNVTVSVEAIQSYRVFVTGEVRLPGVFASEKPINVLQALTLAGAFLDWAKPNDTVIIRGSGTDGVIFDFEYDRVIRGERLDQNILLQSGDVVVVPR